MNNRNIQRESEMFCIKMYKNVLKKSASHTYDKEINQSIE